jgi:methylenetetrahydrofolate reductase (NADPH)
LGNNNYLPWCEDDVISPETNIIRDDLLKLNINGIFTTNSQPAINGISSNDPIYGWGGSGGYVYQKAYLEFFMSPDVLDKLLIVLREYPNITYHALNQKGDSFSNSNSVNAVTWGVFPGKEIIQPTVVDPASFPIWKDEAFEMWKDLYDSTGSAIINNIYNSYFLVNLVDNDYIHSNIFVPFDLITIT